MPKTKRYREARQVQQQDGGAYTDALQRVDEEHERQRAGRQESSVRTIGRPQWAETRGLTSHLRSILTRLDTREAFVAAPAPPEGLFGRGFAPEAGTLVLDAKWRMDLIATATLLADGIRVKPPTIHSDYVEFSWATPSNIEENPFVCFARNLVAVAEDVLKAIES